MTQCDIHAPSSMQTALDEAQAMLVACGGANWRDNFVLGLESAVLIVAVMYILWFVAARTHAATA